MGKARDVFVHHLGELWVQVEPFWGPVTHSDVEDVRHRLDAHLADTPMAGEAMLVADRLHALVDRHEDLDGEQRSVVCAAVTYFLEIHDAWTDTEVGGLSDDKRVLLSAELALNA